ncbi:hypothetical protein BLNAU_18095 [Blattamonas nauphoetae]|uniref:Uncharacterized protein n=1 Tax=Blattamonas nauphoetae TaxID=2049346 RepID=A0ABQ9X5F8_9EUKA|nr:hypothetical protein BLNAU_18095 [Blattamonas nauphoetae]
MTHPNLSSMHSIILKNSRKFAAGHSALIESLGTLYTVLGQHEKVLLLQAVCPHVTFRRLNASGFRVTQGAYSHAKARRGGREQLVLPRRQGPPPSKQHIDIMANQQAREFLEENSTPSCETQVRQRASKQKQRALNDDIFRIPVHGHDDDDTDSLSEFSDAEIMAEPSSPDLFHNFVSPDVLSVALGGHTQSPSSQAFHQNVVSPTVLNLTIQNPHPTPPLIQPPEPRLIQTTKKELYNQMRAQNLITCSYSTFTKQTKHLKRAKRRTDVCQYCEAGKKLERKKQTYEAQGRELTDGELADLNLYHQHKASVAQQRQFYHDTIEKSTDQLLEFFNHTVNRNIIDENHLFVRHTPSPDTELFFTVTLKSLKECLTYERRDGDIFGAYVGQQAVGCSMKRKVLSKTHEVWAGERVTFERPAQDQTSHVT